MNEYWLCEYSVLLSDSSDGYVWWKNKLSPKKGAREEKGNGPRSQWIGKVMSCKTFCAIGVKKCNCFTWASNKNQFGACL